MNCLTRTEIQLYIDKQLDVVSNNAYYEHLENCHNCKIKLQNSIDAQKEISKLMLLLESEQETIKIPVFRKFVNPKPKSIHLPLMLKIAASIVLLLSGAYFVLHTQKIHKVQPNIEMAINEALMYEDPNQMWQNKEILVVMTDENNNVSESYFE